MQLESAGYLLLFFVRIAVFDFGLFFLFLFPLLAFEYNDTSPVIGLLVVVGSCLVRDCVLGSFQRNLEFFSQFLQVLPHLLSIYCPL